MLFSLRGFFPKIHPPEEEVQFQWVDLVLHQQDLESHLGREDQLVTLKQTPNNMYRGDITKFQQYISVYLVVYWNTWKVMESVRFFTLWATFEFMTAR